MGSLEAALADSQQPEEVSNALKSMEQAGIGSQEVQIAILCLLHTLVSLTHRFISTCTSLMFM